MKKVLFIDRDGTLTIEPNDLQLDTIDKLVFYPSVFQYLGNIVRDLDYELVMVTNQDGLGTENFPESDFWPTQNFLINTFKNEGIIFKEVFIPLDQREKKIFVVFLLRFFNINSEPTES